MPGTPTKVSSMIFPASLGPVGPGADFASLSAPITLNILPVKQDGVTPERMFNEIFITAFPGFGSTPSNTSAIFICNTSSPPDVSTFSNVIGMLNPGDQWPRKKDWANNRDIGSLFIGALNSSDFALVVIDQF